MAGLIGMGLDIPALAFCATQMLAKVDVGSGNRCPYQSDWALVTNS